MDKNNMNISRVEDYLNSIFDNVVSDNTFFGFLPKKETLDSSWTDMVFIEIPNGIEDMEAFGQGTVLVWLYARPLPSGRKNVTKMNELEEKLNDAISLAANGKYSIRRRSTYTDYDTNINWHCNAVELIITVT